jgi:probable HAF family extracellular repeat protein
MNANASRFGRYVLTITVVSVLATSDAHAQTRYTATPIPAPVNALSLYMVPTAINASGVIVGVFYDLNDWDNPIVGSFVFDRGVRTDLEGLGDPRDISANGINDRGEIVGSYVLDRQYRAFKMTQGVMIDIHPPGALSSIANGINAAGDVVGSSSGRAFANLRGRFVDLGASDRWSSGTAINSFGDVAGYVGSSAGAYSFRWTNGTMQNLGAVVGGVSSVPNAINASDDIVGYFDTDPSSSIGRRAYLYTNGAMRELPTLEDQPSVANGINAAGHVVGTLIGIPGRAFIYVDGRVHNLTDLVTSGIDGGVVDRAYAINDAGQIAAEVCGHDGYCFAARLDPIAVGPVQAIEYYHADFDHYFLTADPAEIATLDSGAFSGWTRTGYSFSVAPGPQVGTRPVCRFFSTSFAPKSSHFYTASPEECAIVKRNHDWQFEGIVFYLAVPDAAGNCSNDGRSVYRLYNNGRSGAPNHRYTTSTAIRDQMIASGWIAEGNGSAGIALCAN